jgi:hypothetical protein
MFSALSPNVEPVILMDKIYDRERDGGREKCRKG